MSAASSTDGTPDRDEGLDPTVRAELDALARRHQGDPSLAVLRAADAGLLPAPVQAAVGAGLAESHWQQRVVAGANAVSDSTELTDEEVSGLLDRIHRGTEFDRPAPVRSRLIRFYVPVLTALAATVLVAVALREWRPATVVGPPSTVLVAPPAPRPTYAIPVDPAPLKLTAGALVRRSAGQRGAFTDDAAPAFQAYRSGDYRAAAEAFATLERTYPTAPEVPFYLGVSRLLIGDPAGARKALESARQIDDPTFRDDVAWYLAAADERTSDLGAARALLSGLCQGQAATAARACAALAALPAR